jgi:hypothetical protein
MQVVKDFLANQPAPLTSTVATLTIVIGAMCRIFCEQKSGKKVFSLAFPFSVREVDGQFIFYTRGGLDIDNELSSQVLTLVKDEFFGVFGVPDLDVFIDLILDEDINIQMWPLLKELMLAEDLYIRYDFDEERAAGHLHPLHHIDLGYSSGGTFKVGLDSPIDRDTLVGILDVGSECHYLRPAITLPRGPKR